METNTRPMRQLGQATRILRPALAFATSAAIAVATALPAPAADTLATVEVSAGSLAISSASESATLDVVQPGAGAFLPLGGTTVTDNRAGTAGWSATVVLTDFTGARTRATLSATVATYMPAAAISTGVVTVRAFTTTDPTIPNVIQTATSVIGNNTATWQAGLRVQVPAAAVADVYTATLTYSVS
jgi:hypothetical protein